MQIQINGEQQEVRDGLPLSELITHLRLRADQIAVELNHEVLRRVAWAATTLQPGDRVEIVHFVGGGGNAVDFSFSLCNLCSLCEFVVDLH